MDHHLRIEIGLDRDTSRLVRDIVALFHVDSSKLEAALSAFEQKTADLRTATADNAPPPATP